MWVEFSQPQDRHRRFSQVSRLIASGDDDRAGAVGDEAAVEEPQGINDQARRHIVLQGDGLTHLGVLVQRGVLSHRNGHRSELFGASAVFVHVPPRNHRITTGRSQEAERVFGVFGPSMELAMMSPASSAVVTENADNVSAESYFNGAYGVGYHRDGRGAAQVKVGREGWGNTQGLAETDA